MRIGVPTEIKVNEYRVGLVPGSVRELTAKVRAPVSLRMITPTNMPGLKYFPTLRLSSRTAR